MIQKVWKRSYNNQKLVTIPKKSNIKDGDYVRIIKVEDKMKELTEKQIYIIEDLFFTEYSKEWYKANYEQIVEIWENNICPETEYKEPIKYVQKNGERR